MTNKEFAATNQIFLKACELAGLPFQKAFTKGKMSSEKHFLIRQASKWRQGKGLAFTFKNQIGEESK